MSVKRLSAVSKIENKLKALGFELLPPKPPVANYLGSKQVGNLLYVSGRKSELSGVVDSDVTEAETKKAARDCVLLMLSIIKNDIGDLDQIKGVVKMQGFIRSSADFTRQPPSARWSDRAAHQLIWRGWTPCSNSDRRPSIALWGNDPIGHDFRAQVYQLNYFFSSKKLLHKSQQ